MGPDGPEERQAEQAERYYEDCARADVEERLADEQEPIMDWGDVYCAERKKGTPHHMASYIAELWERDSGQV